MALFGTKLLTAASLSPSNLTLSTWSSWDCSWPSDGVHLPVIVTAAPVESLMTYRSADRRLTLSC